MKKLNYLFVLIFLVSCEGEQGEVGPMGSISLINIENETPSDNCATGGYRIETGVDINNNGVLDGDEIQSTQYICNGNNGDDGLKSLVKLTEELAGDNCASGGFKVESGIDINNNGVLDSDEVQSTDFICNGNDGLNGNSSLINVTEELSGDNCTSGGLKIDVGIDTNSNGILDPDEVQSTQYICNGDGAKELRFDFNMSSNASWSTTTSKIFYEFNGIPDFNIDNFQGVDSIIFGAYIQSSNINTNCTLELYDFTNSSVIANSSISTNSSDYVWVTTSQNFIEQLPNEPIDLRLRMTSDNGASVSFTVPRLILLWE
jgi:hypothetical protein